MADVAEETSVPALAVTAAVGAVVLLLILLCGLGRKDNKNEKGEEEKGNTKSSSRNGQSKSSQPGKKRDRPLRKKDSKASFNHPWLAGSLKGHSSPILGMDFSHNGRYLATCAGDRAVLLWTVKEFEKKDHRSVRANVNFDHATRVVFSPDSKAFLVNLHNTNTLRVFKMGKSDDGSSVSIQAAFDFPVQHDALIINIGIASSGKFVMTASSDTTIHIWNLKGEVLASLDTRQMHNTYSCVSPCGRFVASAGFTPDVKVWEVCMDKLGEFKEVVRAFELKGHSAGIYSFAFSNDSHRIATVSKDGTWKFWDTDVEYSKNQDPRLLGTCQYDHQGPASITISPDGRTVALATGATIGIYETESMKCVETIQDIFTDSVKVMEFDPHNKYLAVAGDRHVHIFHNVPGYQATINSLEQQKRKATNQSHIQRIEQQINEARAALEAIQRSPKPK